MSNPSRRRERSASLPVDAWRQVASHLSTSDLSNLALVSKSCRVAALSPDLFAKHIYCQPQSDLLSTTGYQAIYRNSKSLRHAPTTSTIHSRQYKRVNLGILGSISRYLILYNEREGIVSCLPAGWRRRVSELLLEESDHTDASYGQIPLFPRQEFVAARFLEMPDCKIGFFCTGGTGCRGQLVTICGRTGQTTEQVFVPLNEAHTGINFSIGTEKQKLTLLGGVGSQYLVYYTKKSFNVIQRNTGRIVKKWPRMPEAMLIRGETTCNAPLITGVVTCETVGDRKHYHIHPLEGGAAEYSFSIDTEDQLIDVTRSRDGKTITKRIVSDGVVKLWTVVHRNAIFHWLQGLRVSNKSGEVEMRSNGSQVFMRPGGGDGRIIRFTYSSVVRVDKIARRVQGMSFDWARASWDGRIVLAVSRKGGFISIFDCDEGRCLKSISIGDEIGDLVLVDGHLLVCFTAKNIIECHFKRFCKCLGAFGELCRSEEQKAGSTDKRMNAEVL
ncbi:unnamed protein product [Agarophyton chilense]|eukprot:gb/GEZJ01005706.1/.p1 GENE.gb/GEZJ01005706.1/~~gb/GEZJ01005706.1/.p1  ORF type:complete len:500 (-),score=35.96 gb/GEZJ01005706.1/:742-2241(-)